MRLVHQPRDHATLPVAEIALAMGIENLAHRAIGSAFDLFIDIDEVPVEHCRQSSADGGLAHAHQSHQHHGTVDPARDAADLGRGEGRCMGHCRRA